MKLLNRTTTAYLLLYVPIILMAMAIIFFSIRHFNRKHVENSLLEEQKLIMKRAEVMKHFFAEDVLADELLIEEISEQGEQEDFFYTAEIYDSLAQEFKPYRMLVTRQQIAGKPYQITIKKSLVENSTLLYSIGFSMVLLILLLSVTSFFLNRAVLSRKVWSPFYRILTALEGFKAGQKYDVKIRTDIDEFVELDKKVAEMTEKINKDFFVFQEFIDIVSHEYQTPLAVIGNNAELLLQKTDLSEEEFLQLSEIIDYIRKLNRLNKSLLLLSRIDNRQFVEVEKVSVVAIIQALLVEKRFQLEHKNIEVKFAYDRDVILEMNHALADTLFGNLLQNAIRHNFKSGGKIIIELRKGSFHMYNTGEVPKHNNDEIFLKFFKESSTKKSIGLGLSIVKSICQQYDFNVMYEFDTKRLEHHFMVRF